jgi:hypothetical protein
MEPSRTGAVPVRPDTWRATLDQPRRRSNRRQGLLGCAMWGRPGVREGVSLSRTGVGDFARTGQANRWPKSAPVHLMHGRGSHHGAARHPATQTVSSRLRRLLERTQTIFRERFTATRGQDLPAPETGETLPVVRRARWRYHGQSRRQSLRFDFASWRWGKVCRCWQFSSGGGKFAAKSS